MKVDTMRAIDRWAGIPLTFLLTLIRRPFARSARPKPKRILFIELSEMGSTILADPAMRKARTVLDADLFFVIFKRNVASLDLLGTIPRENIRTIREDGLFTLALDTLSFLIWTRRRRIDTVVDMELFSRFTALLTGLCGAANRVGFYRFHNEGLYRGELLTHRVAYNPHIHIAMNFVALINALISAKPEVPYSKTVVGDDEITLPRLVPGGHETQAIEHRIAGVFPPFESGRNRVVLLNPNASGLLPQRRWPIDNFAMLGRRILERWDDAIILITGAPDEAAGAEDLRNRIGHARVVNFAGKSTLADLPLLYSVSALMVSNDSGPAHFASVTDMPTIVLFGPETPSLYAPLGRVMPLTAGSRLLALRLGRQSPQDRLHRAGLHDRHPARAGSGHGSRRFWMRKTKAISALYNFRLNFFRRPVEKGMIETSLSRRSMVPDHDCEETPMKYMLLIYGNEAGMQSATKEQMGQMFAAYGAYTEAMKKAGAFVAGDPLQPSATASTVRVNGGGSKVLNGPYADTKEQLGGVLHRRCTRPRRRTVLGFALPRCQCRHAGSPPDHGDVSRAFRGRMTVPHGSDTPRAAAERVARQSYGKLVAFLAARTRDVAGAEDALSEAFATALTEWPTTGIPRSPEAWLLAVARRKSIDALRRHKTGALAGDHLKMIADELKGAAEEAAEIPDERLRLMFACAHPAIDESIRAPLILQTILGFDAATIGSAFLVAPATMGQRLVRAKTKIRLAGIPFRVPDRMALAERLDAVLDAIYAAFAEGWADPAGTETRRRNLSEEGLWLGRLVASLLPDEPEALGLLALMLFAEARRGARRDDAGNYIRSPTKTRRCGVAPPSTKPKTCSSRRARKASSAVSSWRRRSSRPMPCAACRAAPTGRPSCSFTMRFSD